MFVSVGKNPKAVWNLMMSWYADGWGDHVVQQRQTQMENDNALFVYMHTRLETSQF
jgi:hypothetical protein